MPDDSSSLPGWFTEMDSRVMLDFRRHTYAPRKLRLIASAICRLNANYLALPGAEHALDMMERWVDRLCGDGQYDEAHAKVQVPPSPDSLKLLHRALGRYSDFAAAYAAEAFTCGSDVVLKQRCSDLIRCIFETRLQKSVFRQYGLSDTVKTIARQMYDTKCFDPMPILADALEDGGCEDTDVLAHCRSGGPHFRGCWVVDLILGKR